MESHIELASIVICVQRTSRQILHDKTFENKPLDFFLVPSQRFQHLRQLLQNPKLQLIASFFSSPLITTEPVLA